MFNTDGFFGAHADKATAVDNRQIFSYIEKYFKFQNLPKHAVYKVHMWLRITCTCVQFITQIEKFSISHFGP